LLAVATPTVQFPRNRCAVVTDNSCSPLLTFGVPLAAKWFKGIADLISTSRGTGTRRRRSLSRASWRGTRAPAVPRASAVERQGMLRRKHVCTTQKNGSVRLDIALGLESLQVGRIDESCAAALRYCWLVGFPLVTRLQIERRAGSESVAIRPKIYRHGAMESRLQYDIDAEICGVSVISVLSKWIGLLAPSLLLPSKLTDRDQSLAVDINKDLLGTRTEVGMLKPT